MFWLFFGLSKLNYRTYRTHINYKKEPDTNATCLAFFVCHSEESLPFILKHPQNARQATLIINEDRKLYSLRQEQTSQLSKKGAHR